MHAICTFTVDNGVRDESGLFGKMRIFPRHLKKISYICSMVTNTFTYYNHFKEINKFLMYARFIDGETYEIEVFEDNRKYIYGNFLINYVISGVYEDRATPQGFPMSDIEIKKILKITQPLKFKQIQ